MEQNRWTKLFIPFFILLCGLSISSTAQAISVTFNPLNQTVTLGDQAIVDVIIFGYAPGGTDVAITAFDFPISFDPTILSLASVTFGNSLGNPSTEAISDYNIGSPGVLNISETSLLPSSALYSLQGQYWPIDYFTAATLTFNTIGVGISPLNLTIIYGYIKDQNGNPFPDNYGNNGSVTVNDKVPEPASMLLLGFGLLGLVGVRRKFKK